MTLFSPSTTLIALVSLSYEIVCIFICLCSLFSSLFSIHRISLTDIHIQISSETAEKLLDPKYMSPNYRLY